jgi:glutamyl-tRNA synthetase
VSGAVEDIVENMKWLGLDFDENPLYQSERKDIYAKYTQELVDKGAAYKEEGAIWFKMPKEGQLKFKDLIGNREMVFDLREQKDFVLLKTDSFPTYHLAHVVDDHLMETNPVIRGDEWLSSVPKHILTFKAFNWEIPQYAHLPLILGTDRSKLSKRHGAMGVSEFRKDGFLPEAILNYMAFLGWTPPSGKEVLSLQEMIDQFDLKDVHIAPAVFDMTKLEWMNGEYIRMLSDQDLTKRLQEFLVDHPAKDKIAPVVPLIKERIKKLSDFIPLTNFIFEKPEYDKEIFKKIDIKNQKEVLGKILAVMENLEKPWESKEFESAFRKLAEEEKIKAGEMFQFIRVIVSGQLVTPPLFESIKIMGEKETVSRIKNVISCII